jgi:hypothetical protein
MNFNFRLNFELKAPANCILSFEHKFYDKLGQCSGCVLILKEFFLIVERFILIINAILMNFLIIFRVQYFLHFP